jgi:hypothetical protein
MSEEQTDDGQEEWQAYEPPRITRVRLEADEVLSNSCKGMYYSAQGAPTCSYNGCMASGS